jgi:hypothetical protein
VEEQRGGLTVTYQPEGSAGIAELRVQARVPPFAGAATGYFNDDDLRAFAAAISAYPLPAEAHSRLTAGLGDQETVGLEVAQVTSRGQLAVTIHLAVTDPGPYPYLTPTAAGARMVLLTSYQALHDFAAALLAAIDAQGGTARLPADELA